MSIPSIYIISTIFKYKHSTYYLILKIIISILTTNYYKHKYIHHKHHKNKPLININKFISISNIHKYQKVYTVEPVQKRSSKVLKHYIYRNKYVYWVDYSITGTIKDIYIINLRITK